MAKLVRGTVLVAAVGSASVYAAGGVRNLWNDNQISEKIDSSVAESREQFGSVVNHGISYVGGVMKKTWNSGVISSCHYLQENCDVKAAVQVIGDKVGDAFNSVVHKINEPNPSQSSDDSESSNDK